LGNAPTPSAFDVSRPVDFCGTSSLLVRATARDAVGGLDEQFYSTYYVDIDHCMAQRRHGYVVLYQQRSRILRFQSASTTNRLRLFLMRYSHELFLAKWSAALEEQESRKLYSLAAINRAFARLDEFSERCRREVAPRPAAPEARAPFDRVQQERRHVEMSHRLQNAYIADLTRIIDMAEARPWTFIYRRFCLLLSRLLPSGFKSFLRQAARR